MHAACRSVVKPGDGAGRKRRVATTQNPLKHLAMSPTRPQPTMRTMFVIFNTVVRELAFNWTRLGPSFGQCQGLPIDFDVVPRRAFPGEIGSHRVPAVLAE